MGPASRRVAAVGAAATLILGACSAPDTSPPTSTSSTSRAPFTRPPHSPALGTHSGLPWDSGVVNNVAQLSAEFGQTRGIPLDVIGVSPTRDSWKELLNSWWLSDMAIPAGFRGTLNVALPLFPDDGTMDAAASGAYDAQWEQMGRLIASKYPTAYVRPGWEMNIVDWKWHATPDNVDQYKSAFRHAVTAMRKGGPHLRFVFNPNEGTGNSLPDATLAYPGDDVVDIVGIDAYDWSPAYDERGWRTHLTRRGGWDFWAGFARDHGKQFAVPEWGVIPGSDKSGGDNPTYITSVMDWMHANSDVMAFDTYFDEREDYCRCALVQNPQAQAAYLDRLHSWARPPAATGSRSATPGARPTGTAH